jgi:hypothetical protein
VLGIIYDTWDRDELLLREQVLLEGIEFLKLRRKTTAPQPNGEWLDQQIEKLDTEATHLRELRARKFREDVATARLLVLEGSEDQLAAFLAS